MITNNNMGWHYLSNDTCLIRPRLFYARFVAPGIAILFAAVFATFEEQTALDKWSSTSGSP